MADDELAIWLIEADGTPVGLVMASEEDDPQYRHAGIDIAIVAAGPGPGPRPRHRPDGRALAHRAARPPPPDHRSVRRERAGDPAPTRPSGSDRSAAMRRVRTPARRLVARRAADGPARRRARLTEPFRSARYDPFMPDLTPDPPAAHPGPASVRLTPELVEAIVAHARAEDPNEACGLIVGDRPGGRGRRRPPLRGDSQQGRVALPLRDRPRRPAPPDDRDR